MSDDKQALIDRIARSTLRKVREGTYERRTEAHFLLMLSAACSDEMWAKICARAIVDAADGDVPARAWLSKYFMGDVPTLIQAIQIENVNQIGVGIVDDKQAELFTLGKLLNQVESSIPEGKRSRYNEVVLELSKIVGSSSENGQALTVLAEKMGAPTDNPKLALYDVVTLVGDDD
jgi:hypothetical protein